MQAGVESQRSRAVTPLEPWRQLALAALIAMATGVAYLPAMHNGFVWDDDVHVITNVNLRSVDGLTRIWLVPRSLPQYYPLVHTTFWIEYQLWGPDPTGYHVVNVLLHALNSVLLWIILRRLSVPGALFAALVFAVHPVHVESVAWVRSRKYYREEERPFRCVLPAVAAGLSALREHRAPPTPANL